MMLFGYEILRRKPDLTNAKRVIEWAETIVLNSNYKGEVSRKSFMIDAIFSNNPPSEEEQKRWQTDKSKRLRDEVIASVHSFDGETLHLDPIVKELIKHLGLVKSFLLHEGYIQEPQIVEDFWRLTARGYKMKELGSHKRYRRWKYYITHAQQFQIWMTLGLIFVTFLAAVMPFVVAKVFPPSVTVNVPAQPSRQDIRIDSVWLRQQVDELIQKKLSIQPPTAPTKQQPPKKGGR